MVRILAIGDPHGKVPKNLPKSKIDFILINGDLGRADIWRKNSFRNLKRERKCLPRIEWNAKISKNGSKEVYDSTIRLLKTLSRIAPVYTLIGNLWPSDKFIKKDEKKFGIKLPHLHEDMRKMKMVNITRNRKKTIGELKIGFLEYFVDNCWIKEFDVRCKKRIRDAKKETKKAKDILNGFGKVDILVCHQPPYGTLDKVKIAGGPKHWQGKHAGSKVILNYIKKYQPRYVFCGHIHEDFGERKIGKTKVYNLGVAGHKVVDL